MPSHFFFFNDTATTEIYTLSLHDALPISGLERPPAARAPGAKSRPPAPRRPASARSRARAALHSPGAGQRRDAGLRVRSEEHTLNSSHANISYAVFCLKKKKHISYSDRTV